MQDVEKGERKLAPTATADVKSTSEIAAASSRWDRVPNSYSSACVLLWIVSSCAITLHNKFLLDTSDFNYPYLLTTWHLGFATMTTQLMSYSSAIRRKHMASGITRRIYVQKIFPIALLFSISLVMGNKAYIYLSVPSIQMIKAITPAAVLLVAQFLRLSTTDPRVFVRFTIVVIGGVVASFGDAEFDLTGVFYQMAAIWSHAVRINLSQSLLGSTESGMDPFTCLYYFAPIGTFFVGVLAVVLEVPQLFLDDRHTVSPSALFLNAMLAFTVTLSTFLLLKITSALTLSLCGTLRDVLLVSASYLILGTSVTMLQAVGYCISVAGVLDHAYASS